MSPCKKSIYIKLYSVLCLSVVLSATISQVILSIPGTFDLAIYSVCECLSVGLSGCADYIADYIGGDHIGKEYTGRDYIGGDYRGTA